MILLTALLILLGSFQRLEKTMPVSLSHLSRPTVILDAGHGGEDGGAVGVDGIIEKDINLSIAQDLRDLLVMGGYTVVMTRDSDAAIYDPGMQTLREKKVSDLENRLQLMRDYPGSIFISIHQNQFGSPVYSGTQVFFSPNSQTSQKLAWIIQENARKDLDRENNRAIKEVGDEIFLLWNAPTTAVMVECGFLSNPEEAYKLTDPNYQKRVAFSIFDSLNDYLGGSVPG